MIQSFIERIVAMLTLSQECAADDSGWPVEDNGCLRGEGESWKNSWETGETSKWGKVTFVNRFTLSHFGCFGGWRVFRGTLIWRILGGQCEQTPSSRSLKNAQVLRESDAIMAPIEGDNILHHMLGYPRVGGGINNGSHGSPAKGFFPIFSDI